MKTLNPIERTRNILTHHALTAALGVAMLAGTAQLRGVTETDVSASFATGSTGYQANVPGTGVNLLALPGTTLTPSGAAPATPSLDPDRAYVGTSSSWSTLTNGSVGNGAVLSPTPSFASWITAFFATPGDPNAAPNADPDGDGLKNSVEYVLGTLPNTSNQGGPSASTAGGNFVVTFQRALASRNPDTKVAIEVSTDLAVWIAFDVDTALQVALSTGLDADHETVTLTLPMMPDNTKFARLRVAVTPAS